MQELTAEQKQYQNRIHEQWLELETTKTVITQLAQKSRIRPGYFNTADDIAVWNIWALIAAAWGEALDYIITPPFPIIQEESEQQVIDFNQVEGSEPVRYWDEVEQTWNEGY